VKYNIKFQLHHQVITASATGHSAAALKLQQTRLQFCYLFLQSDHTVSLRSQIHIQCNKAGR